MSSGIDEFEQRLKSDLHRIESDEQLARLQSAIAELPAKERQAFLLRNMEDLDLGDTARAMDCSEDSVKAHYSRAVQALREMLGDI